MASIRVQCETCGTRFKLDRIHLGKRAKCVKCGHFMTISNLPSPNPLELPPAPRPSKKVRHNPETDEKPKPRSKIAIIGAAVGVAVVVLGLILVVGGRGHSSGGLKGHRTATKKPPKRGEEGQGKGAIGLAVQSTSCEWTRGGWKVVMVVHNETSHAIFEASIDERAETPGRDEPWVDSGFSYEIPGGLEPGASATWEFRPSGPEWDSIPKSAAGDLVYKLKIRAIFGRGGERIGA